MQRWTAHFEHDIPGCWMRISCACCSLSGLRLPDRHGLGSLPFALYSVHTHKWIYMLTPTSFAPVILPSLSLLQIFLTGLPLLQARIEAGRCAWFKAVTLSVLHRRGQPGEGQSRRRGIHLRFPLGPAHRNFLNDLWASGDEPTLGGGMRMPRALGVCAQYAQTYTDGRVRFVMLMHRPCSHISHDSLCSR